MPRVRRKPQHARSHCCRHRRRPSATVIRKHNRRRKPSSIEKIVGDWLMSDGIPFQREKPIGRCHVDIFIAPRTIVELNGCFWHGHAICYRELSKAQQLAQAKDARRYAFFRGKGFDIIPIWECEIEKEPDRVREQLRALYRSR